MSDVNSYLVGGYVVGLALLWGYALLLFLESRAIAKAEKARRQEDTGAVNS